MIDVIEVTLTRRVGDVSKETTFNLDTQETLNFLGFEHAITCFRLKLNDVAEAKMKPLATHVGIATVTETKPMRAINTKACVEKFTNPIYNRFGQCERCEGTRGEHAVARNELDEHPKVG